MCVNLKTLVFPVSFYLSCTQDFRSGSKLGRIWFWWPFYCDPFNVMVYLSFGIKRRYFIPILIDNFRQIPNSIVCVRVDITYYGYGIDHELLTVKEGKILVKGRETQDHYRFVETVYLKGYFRPVFVVKSYETSLWFTSVFDPSQMGNSFSFT